jgi:hypothetical protein
LGSHHETTRHKDAFELWYANNRSFSKIRQQVAVPERTFFNWVEWYGWHARADARDAEAAAIADREAIQRRAEMLRRHRQAGELLTRRGMEYYARQAVAKGTEAIAAIGKGVELERTAEGLPAYVAGILTANDEQLAVMERALLAGGAAAGAALDPDAPGGAGEAASDGPERAD